MWCQLYYKTERKIKNVNIIFKEKFMRNFVSAFFGLLLVVLLTSCAAYMDWYYTTLPGGKAQHDAMMGDIRERDNSTSFREVNLTYCEWPDGCLTYENRGHYDVNFSHRNDNSYVRGLINDFNNYVKQHNAVQYVEGRQYNRGTYVYYIDKATNYSPGVTGKDPSGTYFIYVYSLWQL
jgi:hypothetical protein